MSGHGFGRADIQTTTFYSGLALLRSLLRYRASTLLDDGHSRGSRPQSKASNSAFGFATATAFPKEARRKPPGKPERIVRNERTPTSSPALQPWCVRLDSAGRRAQLLIGFSAGTPWECTREIAGMCVVECAHLRRRRRTHHPRLGEGEQNCACIPLLHALTSSLL